MSDESKSPLDDGESAASPLDEPNDAHRGPTMDAGPASRQRKQVLLRLDPRVHEALRIWAASELRSVNSQIEILLRQALRDANRLPREPGPLPRPGRPPGRTSSEE